MPRGGGCFVPAWPRRADARLPHHALRLGISVAILFLDEGHLRSGEAGGDVSQACIDFLDAESVFAGLTYTIPDQRFPYPEDPVHYRGIAVGPHGDRGLDFDRERAAHHFDEEGQ